MWWIAVAVVVAVVAGIGALSGSIVSNVEQPKYEVIAADNRIEIRDYLPMIVAEAEVSGERDQAISDGFRIIADYIFGNNLSSRKVAMTAPVTQRSNEKIAMTAPVTQQGNEHSWQVRFVMPSNYTLDTLPRPNNPAIKLHLIEGKRFAVIRFSGLASEDRLKHETDGLIEFIKNRNLTVTSAPTYAFYNPPWTLPFLRRNEIMIEVAR
jgi:hypothetical protein